MDPLTVAMFGGVVTWALAQWKTVEDIRKVRAETKKLSTFTAPEVKEFFDAKIESVVRKAVEAETQALLQGSPLDQSRRNELRSEVEWALTALFARIERGMKLEIRYNIPPPEEGSSESKQQTQLRQELHVVRGAMVFPKVDSNPVLALPSVKDADPYKPAGKPPRKPRARKIKPEAVKPPEDGAKD